MSIGDIYTLLPSSWIEKLIMCLLVYLVSWYLWTKSRKSTHPGPFGLPIVGNINILTVEKLIDTLRECRQNYGDIVEYFVFNTRLVTVSDPLLAREILAKRPKIFRRSPSLEYGANILKMESCLLFAEGQKWSHARRLVSPSFSKLNVSKHMIIASFQEAIKLRNRLMDCIGKPQQNSCKHLTDAYEINGLVEMQIYTTHVISRVAFGGLPNNNEMQEYFFGLQLLNDMDAILNFWIHHATYRLPNWFWRRSSLFKYELNGIAANERLSKYCKDLMMDKYKSFQNNKNNKIYNIGNNNDNNNGNNNMVAISTVLDTLLHQFELNKYDINNDNKADNTPNDEESMIDEVISQIKILYVAGTETTSTTLSWILYYISQDSKLKEMIRNEIDPIFNQLYESKIISKSNNDNHILCLDFTTEQSSQIQELFSEKKLLLCECVIKETLRLKGATDIIPLINNT
eukprot:gene13956-18719_t